MMSAVAVNILRIVLQGTKAAKIKGIALFILAVVAGYGFYSAMVPDDAANLAGADAVVIPPLVRAPATMHVIRETTGKPVTMPARPIDRASLVRELQTVMTRSACYHGPINGAWTAASMEAMRAFLVAVNAQLPVDKPDQTLLALAQSNGTAKCAPEHAASDDAARIPSPPNGGSGGLEFRAETTPPEAPLNSVRASEPLNGAPMSERAWAPAEMLIPPKVAPQPSATAVSLTAGNAPPVPQSDTASSIEAQSVAVESDETKAQLASTDVSQSSTAPKVARRKTKSRRHKTSDYGDVSRSISKGLNSIQRSLSSVFD